MRWALIILGFVALIVAVAGIGGLLLPQGHVAAVRIALTQPAERVFEAISNVPRQTEWRSGLQTVEVLSGEGEPMRWRETSDFGTITMRVEEAQPPHRLVGLIDDPGQPFGGRWIYQLDAHNEGTTLTITEEGEVYNPFFRFMSRFLFGHHRTLETYARDLAKYLGDPAEPVRVTATR